MKKSFILLILLLLLSSCSQKEPRTVLNSGIDTVSQFSTYSPAPCMLETKDASYQMQITSNDVDTYIEGTYTVSYAYTYEEKEYTCKRKVFVSDDTPPEVTLIPGIDTVTINTEWIDMSVEYSDTNNSDLILTVDSTVDTSKVGNYLVSYKVTDKNKNETIVYRYVHVVSE